MCAQELDPRETLDVAAAGGGVVTVVKVRVGGAARAGMPPARPATPRAAHDRPVCRGRSPERRAEPALRLLRLTATNAGAFPTALPRGFRPLFVSHGCPQPTSGLPLSNIFLLLIYFRSRLKPFRGRRNKPPSASDVRLARSWVHPSRGPERRLLRRMRPKCRSRTGDTFAVHVLLPEENRLSF